MPKVLIYAPTVGRGGVHLVVETLTRGFARYADPKEWQFGVLGQGYDEVHLPVRYPWPLTQIEPVEKLPPYDFQFLIEHAQQFVEHLNRAANGYDLVYCPSPWWTMRVPNWHLQIPFVTNIADFAFDHMDMGILAQHFRVTAALIEDRATTVIFSSEYQATHAREVYNFRRTGVIPYCADFVAEGYSPTPEEARRVRAKCHLPDEYVLAFHCYGHKDPITIIRGQHEARTTSAAVPPLVLAGLETEHYGEHPPANSHIQDVQRVLRESHAMLGRDVFIVGYVPDEDIAGLHTGAMCAVQASHSEGDVSGSALAAIMARLPLIHSQLPVYRERLGMEDQYALSFPVGDFQALGQKIVEVCEQRSEAAQRAMRAYGWSRSRRLDDVVQDYLQVFREVLKS